MKYLYLDETYFDENGTWHCSAGGLLIDPQDSIRHEIELSLVMADGFRVGEGYHLGSETKYSSIFPLVPDETKFSVLEKCLQYLSDNNIQAYISHAQCRDDTIDLSLVPGSNQRQVMQRLIQRYAWSNFPNHIADITVHEPVQFIVDLGLSESFKPIYEIYASHLSGIVVAKVMKIDDSEIRIPNFYNLPIPLFLNSKDSSFLQLSDIIVGVSNSARRTKISEFHMRIQEIIYRYNNIINVYSVHWNKDREGS